MTRAGRRGVSLLEVLTVSAIVLIVALPVLTTIFTSGQEASLGEDTMLAEALGQRTVAEILDLPWKELVSRLPLDLKLQGVPPGDEAIARAYQEYGVNMSGSEGLTGQLTVRETRPGLVTIEVVIEWPVRPGAPARRRLEFVRMRARPDLSMARTYALVPVGSKAVDGGFK